jgi:ABC-type hemin transport system substrate-binding protein
MKQIESLLEDVLVKLSEIAFALEEVSIKLDNINGAYSLDDIATKLNSIDGMYGLDDIASKLDDVATKIDEATDDIVGDARYNLTDIHNDLASIDMPAGT